MILPYFYTLSSDAYGIIRASGELKKQFDITLLPKKIKTEADLLHELEFFKNISSVLIEASLCSQEFLTKYDGNVFLRDRIDGAQLGHARNYINHEKVKVIFKGYRYKDGERNNRTASRCIEPVIKPSEPIDYLKIYLGHGFENYSTIINRPVANYGGYRPLDISFYGSVSKYRRKEVREHRELAYSQLSKYKGKASFANNNKLSHSDYIGVLDNSDSCLSPFGYGEACFRDYEAVLSGAIIIKPDMSSIESYSENFIRHVTYIPCKLDFSDLDQAIKEAKKIPTETRKENILRLLEKMKPESVAKLYGNILCRFRS